jgi:hypothetical protein
LKEGAQRKLEADLKRTQKRPAISIRRGRLNHVIVFNETRLRHILKGYIEYYQRSRTHLSLSKDAPMARAKPPPDLGAVIEVAEVGGLHHRYGRLTAK